MPHEESGDALDRKVARELDERVSLERARERRQMLYTVLILLACCSLAALARWLS